VIDSSNGRVDRGSVMPMTTAFVVIVMVGVFALICASQAWGQRRNIQGVADAAARAAAQLDTSDARRGIEIDPSAAQQRASAVAAGTGVSVSVSGISGLQVTVSATGSVDYAFPVPGFPESMTATGVATAQPGVFAPGG
jgi:Flp pilus assembly protein TadG